MIGPLHLWNYSLSKSFHAWIVKSHLCQITAEFLHTYCQWIPFLCKFYLQNKKKIEKFILNTITNYVHIIHIWKTLLHMNKIKYHMLYFHIFINIWYVYKSEDEDWIMKLTKNNIVEIKMFILKYFCRHKILGIISYFTIKFFNFNLVF